MDWVFTLSSVGLAFALAIGVHQSIFEKNRNLHLLYSAVIVTLIGAAGLGYALGMRQTDVFGIAQQSLLFTFGIALCIGIFWSNMTNKIDGRKLFVLRFCGFLGYIMLLMAIADWHEEMVPAVDTMLFGSTIVLLGFIPAFWAYIGTRWPLGVVTLLWIIVWLLVDIDPVLLVEYYIPLWLVLFSLAVVIGLLPKTIKSLWQR